MLRGSLCPVIKKVADPRGRQRVPREHPLKVQTQGRGIRCRKHATRVTDSMNPSSLSVAEMRRDARYPSLRRISVPGRKACSVPLESFLEFSAVDKAHV